MLQQVHPVIGLLMQVRVVQVVAQGFVFPVMLQYILHQQEQVLQVKETQAELVIVPCPVITEKEQEQVVVVQEQ